MPPGRLGCPLSPASGCNGVIIAPPSTISSSSLMVPSLQAIPSLKLTAKAPEDRPTFDKHDLEFFVFLVWGKVSLNLKLAIQPSWWWFSCQPTWHRKKKTQAKDIYQIGESFIAHPLGCCLVAWIWLRCLEKEKQNNWWTIVIYHGRIRKQSP